METGRAALSPALSSSSLLLPLDLLTSTVVISPSVEIRKLDPHRAIGRDRASASLWQAPRNVAVVFAHGTWARCGRCAFLLRREGISARCGDLPASAEVLASLRSFSSCCGFTTEGRLDNFGRDRLFRLLLRLPSSPPSARAAADPLALDRAFLGVDRIGCCRCRRGADIRLRASKTVELTMVMSTASRRRPWPPAIGSVGSRVTP